MTLSQIAVYPVKSLAGTYPLEAELTTTGLVYDRRWLVVAPDGSFLTQRQFPSMARIVPLIDDGDLVLAAAGHGSIRVSTVEPNDAIQGAVRVQVWGDRCDAVDLGDGPAAFLSEFLGRPCRLVRMDDGFSRPLRDGYGFGAHTAFGFADSAALLLIGHASLVDLNQRLEYPVTMDRFRPNLVVAGSGAFAEDGWNRLRIGDVCFRSVDQCARCQMITIDQESGVKGIEPLETLETYRDTPMGVMFGIKAIHETLGILRVGDPVEVLE